MEGQEGHEWQEGHEGQEGQEGHVHKLEFLPKDGVSDGQTAKFLPIYIMLKIV